MGDFFFFLNWELVGLLSAMWKRVRCEDALNRIDITLEDRLVVQRLWVSWRGNRIIGSTASYRAYSRLGNKKRRKRKKVQRSCPLEDPPEANINDLKFIVHIKLIKPITVKGSLEPELHILGRIVFWYISLCAV